MAGKEILSKLADILRSGHVPLNKFGHLMKKVSSPDCTLCEKIEDVQHLLVECARNRALREDLAAKLKVNQFDVGVFLSALSDPTSEAAVLTYSPLARPGFDALGISAPVLVQMNPDGNWENKKPENIDEQRLRAVVQYLVKSQAVSAAQSYCCQCAKDSQKTGGKSNYVPVIMMPIYPADQCPFDIECEVQKIKEAEAKTTSKKTKKTEQAKSDSEKEKDKKKIKKRGFTLQRLTDFDLLSQW